jgi:protein kinase A/protein kinase X
MVKVKNVADRTPFALKIMKKSEVIRLKQVAHTKGEKTVMMMIDHPFIAQLLTTFQDEKRLFMLLEFVNGGELFSYLRQEGRLPNDHAKFYAGEIILAFAYLHTLKIVYRDLKPENCLLDAEGHMKLTDFGFAKIVESKMMEVDGEREPVETKTWTLCGTPEYLAPEMVQAKGHGKGVDWWALGILIFEMLAGYPPFSDESPFGTYRKILEATVEFPRHFDVKARDLIKRLLTKDEEKRLGCQKHGVEDLKRHKWYKGMDWDQLLNRSLTKDVPFLPPVKSLDDTSMYEKYPESAEGSAAIIAPEDQALFENFSTELN